MGAAGGPAKPSAAADAAAETFRDALETQKICDAVLASAKSGIGIDEVLVFGMIWMVMLGMLLVTAEKGHIALELLAMRVAPRTAIASSASRRKRSTTCNAPPRLRD